MTSLNLKDIIRYLYFLCIIMTVQKTSELHFILTLLWYLYSFIGFVFYESIQLHVSTPWKEPLDLNPFPGIESWEMRLSIVSIIQEYIQNLTQAIYHNYTIIGILISLGIFIYSYFSTKTLKKTIPACIGITISVICFIIARF